MTVKTLIKRLQKLDQNANVVISNGNTTTGTSTAKAVTTVGRNSNGRSTSVAIFPCFKKEIRS